MGSELSLSNSATHHYLGALKPELEGRQGTQAGHHSNYCRNAVTPDPILKTRPGPDLTFVVGHNEGSPFCGPFVILGPYFEPDHHLWPFSVFRCLQFGV